MATYSQMKAAMNEAMTRSFNAQKRMLSAVGQLRHAKVEQDSILPTYSAPLAELAARAAAEPDNIAIQTLQAEVNEMLGDHSSLTSDIDAIVAAVDAVLA